MRRRLPRILLNAATVVSLVFCVVAVTMWVRSTHNRFDTPIWRTSSGRYAVRLDHGGLCVVGPPPAIRDAREAARARELAARLRNADLGWSIRGYVLDGAVLPLEPVEVVDGLAVPGGGLHNVYPARAHYSPGQAAVASKALARPLLDALDDPERWVAAHYVLWYDRPEALAGGGPPRIAGDTLVHDMGGLIVELPIPGPDTPRRASAAGAGHFTWEYRLGPGSARANVAQRVKIRDMWHDRLGVPLVSVAHGHALLAALAVPVFRLAVRLARSARARVLRRHGRCPACGYDLRATPARCPECGAVPAAPPPPAA